VLEVGVQLPDLRRAFSGPVADLTCATANPAGPDLALVVKGDDEAVAARDLNSLDAALLRFVA
jgi:hypothetical protein